MSDTEIRKSVFAAVVVPVYAYRTIAGWLAGSHMVSVAVSVDYPAPGVRS
jgi:hypothetical protein